MSDKSTEEFIRKQLENALCEIVVSYIMDRLDADIADKIATKLKNLTAKDKAVIGIIGFAIIGYFLTQSQNETDSQGL